MEQTDVLAHYGVKGMQWGVRRSKAQLARAAKKGNRAADKKLNKARKREKQAVKQRASVDVRQKQIDRMHSGKLKAKDVLEIYGNANYVTAIQAVANKQSYRKQYASEQKAVLEKYKGGLAKREAKTKSIRNEAAKLRKGANEAQRLLDSMGKEKISAGKG